jgi:UDP-N-acetylglucosamine--N-acetylmuramyl-(pentapeptide) pyrophosphoryl-undecaprenol N-acetylglucosamine transferase
MQSPAKNPYIAIACGGTGGHLFPGLAVAEELLRRDCDVAILISPKEVDQQAVKAVIGMEVVTLPAVGLTRGGLPGFAAGFYKSRRAAGTLFRKKIPDAVLAMGGFTSAPPVLAGKKLGAKTFLHESNTIPGRANRWLAHVVDEAFVYFHEASGRMNIARASVTGMPVRSQFLDPIDSAAARMALGLEPEKPVLLVMGGSQGASGINSLALGALPILSARLPDLQILHLTGASDFQKIQAAYAAQNRKAVVRPFLTEMEFALGAASVCISRSGASSLAEIAAMKLPSILIPYPTATDDHQFYNALAFVESGAAKMFQQSSADPNELARTICELIENKNQRDEMQIALANWHSPDAAEKIANRILESISVSKPNFQKRAEHFSNRIQRDSRIDSLRENFEQEAAHV